MIMYAITKTILRLLNTRPITVLLEPLLDAKETPVTKARRDADRAQLLRSFENTVVQKYIYSKTSEKEKDKLDKKVDSMLHG